MTANRVAATMALAAVITVTSVAAAASQRQGIPATRPATSPATAPATVPSRPPPPPIRQTVEEIAAALPWLDQEYLSDREPWSGPEIEKVRMLWHRLRGTPALPYGRLAALAPGPWSADEIRPLLRHADPKVRTLAVVLLYQLNRVDVLPDIAELLYDDAATYDWPTPHAMTQTPGQSQWWWRKRSVSDFARAAVQAYAGASPELRVLGSITEHLRTAEPDREALRRRLRAFVEKRNPEMCTAALVVAMRRAAPASPLPDDRYGRVDALYRLVQDEVQMPRRFFVVLHLGFHRVAHERYGDYYLGMMARQVPRDMRLKAIRFERAIDDDPDLPAVGRDYFIRHVTELFRASDADLFLQHERDERKRMVGESFVDVAATYAVLAARLRPAEADAILDGALVRITGTGRVAEEARMEVATAMAQLGNDASQARAADVLFAYKPERSTYGGGRESLLYAVGSYNIVRGRQFHERIIRDPRLGQLGPPSTRHLMEAVQGYLGRPLTDEATMRDSYGINEAQRDRDFQHLKAWHDALRAMVDEWSR